jgi:hypothetical protein
MAKVTHCNFCNKELTTGFFGGTANSIYLTDVDSVVCCDECREKYKQEAKRVKKRFITKVDNCKASSKKKMDETTLAKAFLRYLAEEKEQIERCGLITDSIPCGFFGYDEQRAYFAVREYRQGDEVFTKKKIKNINAASEIGEVWFCKDDVTRLEYRVTSGFGESTGLFSSVFEFDVRLNDEKNVTYKPCITKMYFMGKGLFPHSQKKKAKLQCAKELEVLKNLIGSELTVTEVKKFN